MTENEAIKELKDENEQCYEQCEEACSDVKNNKCTCRDAVIVSAFEELKQYHSIGTVEECQKSATVRKEVTEIVNRQLIAGKNNYKEVYKSFYDIVKVIQDNY